VKLWDATTAHGRCVATFHGSYDRVSFNAAGTHLDTDKGSIDLPLSLCRRSQPVAPDTSSSDNDDDDDDSSQQYGLSRDGIWVTCRGKNVLRLPSEYRASVSAVMGSTIALGCRSGRVWFLWLSEDIAPST
jgi:hypothetical protein